jgi:hypothetical protein
MAIFLEETYTAIDHIIQPWARQCGVQFELESKGYAVRTFWIAGRVQIWIDSPDEENYVKLHIAERNWLLKSGWGKSIVWRLKIDELPARLDEAIQIGNHWISNT